MDHRLKPACYSGGEGVSACIQGSECMQRQISGQIKPWHVDFSSDMSLAQASIGKSLIYACVLSTILGILIRCDLLKCN